MALHQESVYSDPQLIGNVAFNGVDAFDEIYRRYAAPVTATAQMILGQSSACESVVAQVFRNFWLEPENFDATQGSLLGFLRLKARVLSIEIVRTGVTRGVTN